MTNKILFEFSISEGDTTLDLALMRPNRELKWEGETYYLQVLSKYIELGVMPRVVWSNMIQNNGGTISKPEEERLQAILKNLLNSNNELQALRDKVDKTPEEAEQQENLSEKVKALEREISEIQYKQISLWENTAESKARTKELMWWVSMISYVKERGEWVPFARGKTPDDRLDYIDELYELDDKLTNKALSYFTRLVSAWYVNSYRTKEQFDAVIQSLKEENNE